MSLRSERIWPFTRQTYSQTQHLQVYSTSIRSDITYTNLRHRSRHGYLKGHVEVQQPVPQRAVVSYPIHLSIMPTIKANEYRRPDSLEFQPVPQLTLANAYA